VGRRIRKPEARLAPAAAQIKHGVVVAQEHVWLWVGVVGGGEWRGRFGGVRWVKGLVGSEAAACLIEPPPASLPPKRARHNTKRSTLTTTSRTAKHPQHSTHSTAPTAPAPPRIHSGPTGTSSPMNPDTHCASPPVGVMMSVWVGGETV